MRDLLLVLLGIGALALTWWVAIAAIDTPVGW